MRHFTWISAQYSFPLTSNIQLLTSSLSDTGRDDDKQLFNVGGNDGEDVDSTTTGGLSAPRVRLPLYTFHGRRNLPDCNRDSMAFNASSVPQRSHIPHHVFSSLPMALYPFGTFRPTLAQLLAPFLLMRVLISISLLCQGCVYGVTSPLTVSVGTIECEISFIYCGFTAVLNRCKLCFCTVYMCTCRHLLLNDPWSEIARLIPPSLFILAARGSARVIMNLLTRQLYCALPIIINHETRITKTEEY